MPLIVKNEMVDKIVCKMEFGGTINLSPFEVRTLLEWAKHCPVSNHLMVKLGEFSPVTANKLCDGSIEAHVAYQDASRVLFMVQNNIPKVRNEK